MADTASGAPGSQGSVPLVAGLDELTELVVHRPVYLRYSEYPAEAEQRSTDLESGVELPGLSVTTLAPEPRWPRPAREWVARRLCTYADLGAGNGRRPWLLAGQEVARGPDHDPVITDAWVIAVVDDAVVAAARHVYRTKFAVGRDSSG
ncbi:DUF6098 family protein [Nocardia stercoris]|uniref:Uncharacterized protein n=1 Tax=Nocardia stercoris TaxID=2483361 RepID=A0A3M2LBD2_9NOCA|nr:DUF6098 family protein [Nocardia stercoris]RMI33245.1 hypothetical protein EBN03_08630 [Nocardia stercoris]